MTFENKKVLVTGGGGFIGSNLAIKLVEVGAKVTVLDSFLPGLGGNPFNLQPIEPKIHLDRTDLRETSKLNSLVEGQDYIFNLAGQVSHQDSMTDPFADLELNAWSHLNLLETCRRHNPKASIVYTSTRQVYGVPKTLPVDESQPVNPVDINGIHAFAGEHYHTLYAKVHGLKTVSLRLTNTYGPRQMIKHSRQGFIAWFVNRALKGETIHLYGGGRQIRDFNFVDDVVDALLRAALHQGAPGQVYNLSGEQSSIGKVAERLVRLTGKGRIDEVEFPDPLKKIDIGDYFGNSEKFQQATGWRLKTSLEEGLAKTVDFYETNRKHYLD